MVRDSRVSLGLSLLQIVLNFVSISPVSDLHNLLEGAQWEMSFWLNTLQSPSCSSWMCLSEHRNFLFFNTLISLYRFSWFSPQSCVFLTFPLIVGILQWVAQICTHLPSCLSRIPLPTKSNCGGQACPLDMVSNHCENKDLGLHLRN